MPVIKKKMSTSAYILIALIIVAVISLPILHMVGVINLTFLADGFSDIMLWASENTLNGALLMGGVFTGGAFFYYIVRTYLLGTQVPVTAGTYTPMGRTISQPQQQEEETVVSD